MDEENSKLGNELDEAKDDLKGAAQSGMDIGRKIFGNNGSEPNGADGGNPGEPRAPDSTPQAETNPFANKHTSPENEGSNSKGGSDSPNQADVGQNNTNQPQAQNSVQNPKDGAQGSSAPPSPQGSNMAAQSADGISQGAQAGAVANTGQIGAASGAQATSAGAESAASAASASSAGAVASSSAASAAGGAAAGASTVAGTTVAGTTAAGTTAAGTAAGGPVGAMVGAAVGAAISLGKPLYKLLMIICIPLIILSLLLSLLPSMIFNGNNKTQADMMDDMTACSDRINEAINEGYQNARDRMNQIIDANGYDVEMCLDSLADYGINAPELDMAFIISVYSVSMQQKNTHIDDLISKLLSKASEMFPLTYVEKTAEKEVVVEQEDVYEPTDAPVPNAEPETEIITVTYAEFTIHPFNQEIIWMVCGIQPDDVYDSYSGVTCATAAESMAMALKRTLGLGYGDILAITDLKLLEYLQNVNATGMRKHVIEVALSLVGRVKYFWGGTSPAGWNSSWGEPRLVTTPGSSSTGTIRPFGLDCSGFTSWVYRTAGVGDILNGYTGFQWDASHEISIAELKPGDLGFQSSPDAAGINHVGIFYGTDEKGNMLWIHCSSSAGGVVINNTAVFKHYRRVNDSAVLEGGYTGPDFSGLQLGMDVSNLPETPLLVKTVDITHYCPCTKCCGKYADGMTASGKLAQEGMVATGPMYPFGTIVEINGKLYIVEDRGDSGINASDARIDIFVSDHNRAVQLGRFMATARFYRFGR